MTTETPFDKWWREARAGQRCLFDIDLAREAFAAALAQGRREGAEEMRESQDPLEDLVSRFSVALLEKLKASREKYEFGGEPWQDNDWRGDLLWMIRQHLDKGDPRDVAAYCAFAWHHGWSLSLPTTPEDAREGEG